MRDQTTLVDAHVHIHDCFALEEFLGHAVRNFRRVSASTGATGETAFMLLLTESYGADYFSRLAEQAAKDVPPGNGYRCVSTDEPQSIIVRLDDGAEVFIVAGRQIVTIERLEILALGTRTTPPDGQAIRDVIEQVRAENAICVLPWGFGKWTGARGKLVSELLAENRDENFFLGDNAGRLGLWPEPRDFDRARKARLKVLPGSDPLPFKSGVRSAGRFGFALPAAVSRERPFDSLCQMLIKNRLDPEPFGKLESLLPFMFNQVRMQLRKKNPGSARLVP